MDAQIKFVGKGWSFPPEFSLGGKELLMVTDVEDIKQSLEILFGTRLGERILQEDFGSSLVDYQFEEMSSPILNRITNMIKDAILYYEPRIQLNGLSVQPDPKKEGYLLIQLDFNVRTSNTRFNMVYDYYLSEANT